MNIMELINVKVDKMGHLISAYIHPDINPDISEPPTFNALYGFPNGRKERGDYLEMT